MNITPELLALQAFTGLALGSVFVLLGIGLSLIFGLLSSVVVLFPTGHYHAEQVARTQPEKLAAIEGLIHGQTGAPCGKYVLLLRIALSNAV